MNNLLIFGLLIITAYLIGLLLEKIQMPKIIGYIITGVVFSPQTIDFIGEGFTQAMESVLKVSLAFIAFEIGGELKWSKIKAHKNEVLSITLLASLIPFALISAGLYAFVVLFPQTLSLNQNNLLLLTLILGALAAPTAPASIFAVIHQYKAKGKVTETILEIVALDDVLGILLFSITIATLPFFADSSGSISESGDMLNAFYEILSAIATGAVLGYLFNPISRFLKIKSDDQWIIIIFSLILLATGISILLDADELLIAMTMGLVVVNTCKQKNKIFGILKRYTENLIFLIFFLLSGLHLDISVIPKATPIILLFVVLRYAGKYLGVNVGGFLANADPRVRKYTYGGLIPQAGVAIGLVLSIYQKEGFGEISDILLSVIMGATIINELAGPVAARYVLKKSGEAYSGEKSSGAQAENGSKSKSQVKN